MTTAMVWFVSLAVVFERTYPAELETALEERLRAAGTLYEEGAVHGDPGPSLRVAAAIRARDAATAKADGVRVVCEALAAEGVDPGAFQVAHVGALPMSAADPSWRPPHGGG